MDDAAKSAVDGARAKAGRWKRILRRTIVATALALLCVTIALQNYIRTLHSLRRIPGTNAYVMDYYVDYNIGEVRTHGIDVNHVEDSLIDVFFPKWISPIAARLKSAYISEPITAVAAGEHCSSIVLHTNDGHVYFGRNLDYSHDSCLILKVHGANGVSSIAVLDLHYLNLNRDDLDQTSLIQRIPLLFAPYYLEDGMNQYGLAVSDMSVDGARPPRDPARPNIIHSAAMRLILDYAHSTDEAIEILRQYNIHFVAETCHLMIADAAGKSVVVEFIDGQLKPTASSEKWQVCTNHQLCGKSETENCNCCGRYRLASIELADLRGNGNAADVMKVMQSVSKTNWTMWTSVYNLSTGEFEIAYRQHYEKPYVDHISTVP